MLKTADSRGQFSENLLSTVCRLIFFVFHSYTGKMPVLPDGVNIFYARVYKSGAAHSEIPEPFDHAARKQRG